MKRFLLFLSFVFCTLQNYAQLGKDGYYRVQNVKQSRYISVIDDRGSINYNTTSADFGALRTVYGFENVVSDPSTIIYFKKMSEGYNLQSQGTGVVEIINYQVSIGGNATRGYYASASKSGMTKYLSDELLADIYLKYPEKYMSKIMYGRVVDNSSTTRLWFIKPVSATSDCYFGVSPDVTVDNSYYKSFFAAFPFTFNSTGMNAYYVSKVDAGKAAVVIKEITGGVPGKTPVIIKCSSDQPANNKLNIGDNVSGSTSGNLLKGVYFCNDVDNTSHRNVVNYDAATMRVLGTAADGSLAFVKSSTLTCIPANTAYITVPSTAPDVLKVYSQSEYDALPSSKRGDLNGDGSVDIQDLGEIIQMILHLKASTPEADLNNDGSVDIQDHGTIVRIILKLE